jgi:hypothetical protein
MPFRPETVLMLRPHHRSNEPKGPKPQWGAGRGRVHAVDASKNGRFYGRISSKKSRDMRTIFSSRKGLLRGFLRILQCLPSRCCGFGTFGSSDPEWGGADPSSAVSQSGHKCRPRLEYGLHGSSDGATLRRKAIPCKTVISPMSGPRGMPISMGMAHITSTARRHTSARA